MAPVSRSKLQDALDTALGDKPANEPEATVEDPGTPVEDGPDLADDESDDEELPAEVLEILDPPLAKLLKGLTGSSRYMVAVWKLDATGKQRRVNLTLTSHDFPMDDVEVAENLIRGEFNKRRQALIAKLRNARMNRE
jgi:hypothetical protein